MTKEDAKDKINKLISQFEIQTAIKDKKELINKLMAFVHSLPYATVSLKKGMEMSTNMVRNEIIQQLDNTGKYVDVSPSNFMFFLNAVDNTTLEENENSKPEQPS